MSISLFGKLGVKPWPAYECTVRGKKQHISPTYAKRYFLCFSPWKTDDRGTDAVLNLKDDHSFGANSQQNPSLRFLLWQHTMEMDAVFRQPLANLCINVKGGGGGTIVLGTT